MRKFCFKLSLTLWVLLLASCVFAFDPALTLRDRERGTTVDLYPVHDESDKGLLFYGNDRFGYSIHVPFEVFTEVVTLPDNGDGMILASKDGKAHFRVSGGYVVDENPLKTTYEAARKELGRDLEDFSFYNLTDESWELCWWDGSLFYQRKFVANEEVWAECEIAYPAPKNEGSEDPVGDLVSRAIESLALGKE